jgi:NodT family efflux transporter outer membrane factor (OMF) lipoprotein
MKRKALIVAALSAVVLISGCSTLRGLLATVGPNYKKPEVALPEGWQAKPLPHDGNAGQLQQWWAQFNDPVFNELIAAAQKENASLAQAAARIERARADLIGAGAQSIPNAQATASFNRSAFTFSGPITMRNQAQIGLQLSWELDLFGGLARQREAAGAQFESDAAAWHDARVAVAVEVANAYANYRYCEKQLALAKVDAESRAKSLELIDIAARAGFESSSDLALAQASAADGVSTVAQRRSQCDLAIKGLVALTAIDENTLRQQLTSAPERIAVLPTPHQFTIHSLPAQVITQRPDVASAERSLAAASATIGVKTAVRFPSISLTGNITPTRLNVDGGPYTNVRTWSIGPTVSLPVFDGGASKANVKAAESQYFAAESAYRSKVRVAIKEVEEALVRLSTAAERLPSVQTVARGYKTSFDGAQTKQRAGMGSLIEMELARRSAVDADAALAALEFDRVSAWVALYRAVGGGWDGSTEIVKNSQGDQYVR